jgi:hypothetical protein
VEFYGKITHWKIKVIQAENVQIKAKSKVVNVLNYAPRHENI